MFQRFTPAGRAVVVDAQQEARSLNHHYIGVEHLLLSLAKGGDARDALQAGGVEYDRIKPAVEAITPAGDGGVEPDHIPFTPRAKKVLELSLREALRLGHNWIDASHLLLALLREDSGVAHEVLAELGADLDAVKASATASLELLDRGTRTRPMAAGEALGRTASIHYEELAAGLRRAKRIAGVASGPTCPSCDLPLTETSRYRMTEVAEADGARTIRVLFVFCSACGHTLDTVSMPDDE
ncbi:MAG TPA: Clp protease N-terminal domain-containing protein [Actinomycetota bacterium]